MTNGELIDRLSEHPRDVGVNFGYEGVFEAVARVERMGPEAGVWAGEILLLGTESGATGLTERERLVLAWDKGPEEWEDEHGGQYGAELVDAERKRAELLRQGRYDEARKAGDAFVDGFMQAEDGP